MKIMIDGYGGHLCQASLEDGTWEVGDTIEKAIGRLIRLHPQECGVETDILPCETTAYEESWLYICPICYQKLDYTPCYIEVRKCPNGHYAETASHYYCEKEVNGEIFGFDDSGYGNDKSRTNLREAIEKAKREYWKTKTKLDYDPDKTPQKSQ